VSEIEWFYLKDGQPTGPVPHRQFCAMFATGELRLDAMVWCKQFRDWAHAGTVGGFRKMAETAPPPPVPTAIPFASVAPGAVTSLTPPPLPPLPVQPVEQAQPSIAPVVPAEPAPVPAPAPAPAPTAWAGPTMDPDFKAATGTVYDEEGHAMTASPADAWARWWARSIDLMTVGLVGAVVTALLRFDGYVASYCFSFTWVLVEPLLLSTWGTTVGKWTLGISVRRRDGGTLTYGEALNRTFVVYLKGLALNIPVLNVVTQVMAYNHLTSFGQTVWDEEGGFKCRVAPQTGGRIATAAVATLLILGLSGATAAYSAWDEDRREAQLVQSVQAAEDAEDQWADAEDAEDEE
jgi:uncharacterized RDD family membrane protein YckC